MSLGRWMRASLVVCKRPSGGLAVAAVAGYKFACVLQRCRRAWGGRFGGGAAIVCGVALAATLGCAVDLRPASLSEVPDAAARAAGAARLAELGRTQGLDRWERFSELRFQLLDSSVERCFVGGLATLWSASQAFEIQLAVRDTAVRARFVDGPRAGETVGIKRDLAYRIADSGVLEFEADACAERYLGALAQALVLPLRLLILSRTAEASAFAAGERSLGGRSYDLVFVTRPASYGTRAEEQAVLWIDRSSGRIEWLEHTDRRRSRRARSVLHYMEYRDVEGVMLPSRIDRVDAVGASAGERLELSELALD